MTRKLNPEEYIRAMLKCVNKLRKHNPNIPPQQISILFEVYLNPGCTMVQLKDNLGLAQSSVSRSIAALSKLQQQDKLGLNLVKAIEDPRERRRKVVKLTPKGEYLMRNLLENFEPLEQ
jgi:DNA-binding MarR family transcriptional regulator